MTAQNRNESPAPTTPKKDEGLTEDRKTEAAERRLKAIKKCKEEAAATASVNCCCCSCSMVVLFFTCAHAMWTVELEGKCNTWSTDLALEAFVTVSCDGALVQEAAEQKRPIFLSCPLDKASLARWTPEDFGFRDFKSGFSATASWAHQEISMYQCEENAVEHTERSIDPHTLKISEKKSYTYTYSLGWRNEPVSSNGFNGLDGVFLSADKASNKVLQTACGENFKGNPPFPSGMQTGTKAAKAITVADGKIDVSRYKKSIKMESIALDPTASVPKPYRLLEDGTALASCDLNAPTLGCVHISYKRSTVTSVSLMAMPVKTWNSFTLDPWPAHGIGNTGSSVTDHCIDTGFDKAEFFAEGSQTVDDLVRSSLRSFAWALWKHRLCCFFIAGITMCIVWYQMRGVALGMIWHDAPESDDVVQYWYNVGESECPILTLFALSALMILGFASWMRKDGFVGQVGLGASLLGHIVAISMLAQCGEEPTEDEKKFQ